MIGKIAIGRSGRSITFISDQMATDQDDPKLSRPRTQQVFPEFAMHIFQNGDGWKANSVQYCLEEVRPQAAQAYSLCYAIYTYIKTLYGNFWIGWFIRGCMEIHSISQKYMLLLWMMK